MSLKLSLILAIFSSLLLSSVAHSSSLYSWKQIYEVSEKAEGEEGFTILQNKYPKIFGVYDVQSIASANLITRLYKLEGPHTCSLDDPRLTYESRSYEICEKTPEDDIRTWVCSYALGSIPAPHDPCVH